MKNIIIVTGGAGFVGSNLINLLLKKTNKKIISLDNYSSGLKKNHVKNYRVKYLIGNTLEIEKKFFKYKKNIHSVFHFGEFSRKFSVAWQFFAGDSRFIRFSRNFRKIFAKCFRNFAEVLEF